MKKTYKTYIYMVCFVILIIAIVLGRFYAYKAKKAELDEFNLGYEQYTKEEIYGTQLATVINKAIHNNEVNEVEKQYIEKNNKKYYTYITNDINSIKVDIKMIDNNKTYKMESLYQSDLNEFVQHYNSILFKCTNIEYNEVGKVSYLLFEQISK